MAKSIVVEGKTSTEAIEKGLKELKARKDDVEIKILEEENKRKFYSILTPRVVKVELTLKDNIKQHKENEQRNEYREEKKKKNFNNNMEEIQVALGQVENFLNKLFKKENYDIRVEIVDYDIKVNIDGENINNLIGYRGETINALQTILMSVVNRAGLPKIRVIVDVAGYKIKREKTLEELAEKIAKTVIRTGKSVTLEPMSAYERKIIHTKLQQNEKIETFSKGEEPHRRIVIALKK